MPDSSITQDRLEAVVLDGRKRLLWQSAVRDAALGLAIAMAGPVALLALGTDYFPAALVWIVAIGGIAAGIYRWARTQPHPYRVAQLLDRRWNTDDQVSTAYYFLKESSRPGPVAEQQRAAAADLAAKNDLVAALPFRLPQAAWGTLAMLALIAVLFVVRYSLHPALSLQRPLSSMLIQALLGAEPGQQTANLHEPEAARLKQGDDEDATSLNEEGETRNPESKRPEQPAEPLGETSLDQPNDALNVPVPEVEGLSLDEQYGDEMNYNSLAEGEKQDPQGDRKGEKPGDSGTPSEQASETSQDSKSTPWDEKNDSLLDKLKDAFQNMLAKMDMKPQAGEQQQAGEGDPQSNSESTGEKADAAEGQAQGGASESGEAQMEGGEPGESAAQQTAQGEGGNNSDQPSQGQPAVAAGSNDGSKELDAQAKIQEAMGRLEELYSKRAEEIKGEVMIETESAKQSARAPYQPTEAGHQDAGGQVSRDAIPLAYQTYIKSYFENLRTKN